MAGRGRGRGGVTMSINAEALGKFVLNKYNVRTNPAFI